MADGEAIYTSVAGFIQFPVEERELDSGQTVRDATIRSLTTGDLIRITFWPDFEGSSFDEGDFIAVDGVVKLRYVDGRDKPYVNMNARALFVGTPEEIKEREVVKKTSGSKSSGKRTF